MKKRISYSLVRALKPAAKPYQISDTELAAFKVRVQPTGSIIFQLRVGRSGIETLGRFPDMTPDEARALAERRLPAIKSQPLSRPGVPTFAAFLESEYRPHVEATQNAAAKNMYRLRAMVETFGASKLNRIDERMVESFRRGRLDAGRNAKTVDNDITELRTLLNKAVEWRVIAENPISRTKLMRPDNRRVRFLTTDHERHLRSALLAAPGHLHAMALVAMNTGMRFGELTDLAWTDVDFEERILTVRPRGQRSGKRGGRRRHIPINDEAKDVLTAWRGERRPSGTLLVFPNRDGQPFDNVRTSWRSTLRRTNEYIASANLARPASAEPIPPLEDFRWHDLRHHFASRLVQAGVNLYAVQQLLGHQSYQMVQRYAHLAPRQLADAVASLAR